MPKNKKETTPEKEIPATETPEKETPETETPEEVNIDKPDEELSWDSLINKKLTFKYEGGARIVGIAQSLWSGFVSLKNASLIARSGEVQHVVNVMVPCTNCESVEIE